MGLKGNQRDIFVFSMLTLLFVFFSSILMVEGRVALVLKNRLFNNTSESCLDSMTSQQLIYTNCTAKNSQLFYQDNTNRIANGFNGRCMETTGIPGSPVIMNGCNSITFQRWDRDEFERFHSRWNSSLCLALSPKLNSTTGSSLEITIQLCDDSPGQKWYRMDCGVDLNNQPIKIGCQCPWEFGECRGILTLKNRGGLNYCVENSNPVSPYLWYMPCSPSSSRQQITYDSHMRLVIANSGKCIESSFRNGFPVYLAACSNSANQKWLYDTIERFRSIQTGLCLDVTDESTSSLIVARSCSPSNNQKWYRTYCIPGEQVTNDFGCEKCPYGYFKSVFGNEKCSSCPHGQFTSPLRDFCFPSEFSYGTVLVAGGIAAGLKNDQGSSARFNTPYSAIEVNDSIFVADTNNHVIRQINRTGFVSTYAGNSIAGYRDGPDISAMFNFPMYIVSIESNGTLLVSDSANSKLRMIDPTRNVSTYIGFDRAGFKVGNLATAQLNRPIGLLSANSTGLLYIIDRYNNRLRRLDQSGQVGVFAGKGPTGSLNGPRMDALFFYPWSLAMDEADNIYITDRNNNLIRKINATGFVSTIAGGTIGSADGHGSKAQLLNPEGIVYHGATRSLYVTERASNKIRRVTLEGNVSTIPALNLNQPLGLSLDMDGNLLMTDLTSVKRIIPCINNTAWNSISISCECYFGFKYENSTGSCALCPLGKYKDWTGNGDCANCPLGTESSSDRISCSPCPEMKDRHSSVLIACVECRPGTFKNITSAENCQSCPLGEFTNLKGSRECSKCPLMTESNANKTGCVFCSAGKVRKSSDIPVCVNCPDDFYKPDQGDSDCVKCPPGSYSNGAYTGCVECPKGHYLTTNRTCEHCGLGKEPSVDRTECIVCPSGSFKPISQLISCIPCPQDAECDSVWFKCKAGYFSNSSDINSNTYECHKCPYGMVKSNLGNMKTDCQYCPIGYQPNDEQTVCMECPEGKYRSINSTEFFCIDCPLNSYNCSSTGFECLNGYTVNQELDSCVPFIDPSPFMIVTTTEVVDYELSTGNDYQSTICTLTGDLVFKDMTSDGGSTLTIHDSSTINTDGYITTMGGIELSRITDVDMSQTFSSSSIIEVDNRVSTDSKTESISKLPTQNMKITEESFKSTTSSADISNTKSQSLIDTKKSSTSQHVFAIGATNNYQSPVETTGSLMKTTSEKRQSSSIIAEFTSQQQLLPPIVVSISDIHHEISNPPSSSRKSMGADSSVTSSSGQLSPLLLSVGVPSLVTIIMVLMIYIFLRAKSPFKKKKKTAKVSPQNIKTASDESVNSETMASNSSFL